MFVPFRRQLIVNLSVIHLLNMIRLIFIVFYNTVMDIDVKKSFPKLDKASLGVSRGTSLGVSRGTSLGVSGGTSLAGSLLFSNFHDLTL